MPNLYIFAIGAEDARVYIRIYAICLDGMRDYFLAAFFYYHPRAGGDPWVAYRPRIKVFSDVNTGKIDSRPHLREDRLFAGMTWGKGFFRSCQKKNRTPSVSDSFRKDLYDASVLFICYVYTFSCGRAFGSAAHSERPFRVTGRAVGCVFGLSEFKAGIYDFSQHRGSQ